MGGSIARVETEESIAHAEAMTRYRLEQATEKFLQRLTAEAQRARARSSRRAA